MTTLERKLQAGRGRDAETPFALPWRGWKDISWRVYSEFSSDRITLVAAGATFYMLLALFPALAAFVSLYGFVADPVTIADHIAFLGTVLPSGGVDLIRSQLESLAQQNEAALSFGFVFGLLFALWSANNGIKTLFQALNVVYEEREKRSFIRVTLISFLFTLGAIVLAILFIISVGVVPAVLSFVGLGAFQEELVSLLRWPVLIVASALAISLLYRFGPSREYAQWQWISWGSLIATLLWFAASALFSWYLSNFANYNATYGSLGAVIGFMMWTWISVVILLAGAELNAEMEHQTALDTTTGAPQPMGLRGATMADTLGRSRSEGYSEVTNAFDASRRLSHHPADLREPQKKRRAEDGFATALGCAVFGTMLGGLAVSELADRRNARRQPRAKHAQTNRSSETTGKAVVLPALAIAVRGIRTILETPAGRDLVGRAIRPRSPADGRRRRP